MTTHKALGRGLEALLKPVMAGGEEKAAAATKLPVDKIRPNRFQPRTRFTPDSLRELADSIKTHGLTQPILVSPSAVPGEYELIAGERRLRAAKLAGLLDIPCVVRAVTDRERHELALVENLQREDLNPIEEAESVRKLMEASGMTQEEAARRLHKSRSAVANKLRLLDLPQVIRNALMENLLTEGHARALLGLQDKEQQAELGKRIVHDKLTVREVERLVADWASAVRDGRVRAAKPKNADLRHLEEELQRHLGRRVVIDAKGKNKGWVRLEFYSIDDMDVLTQELRRHRASK